MCVRTNLNDATNLGTAREGDLVNVHVGAEAGAAGWAIAAQKVEHARGEASLVNQTGGDGGGQRCLLGGLEDHDVARGQARGNLPHEHQEGEVPLQRISESKEALVIRE